MKMKLFLCVLCLALFAEGLLPQTAPVDEATRLTQVELALGRQAEDISEIKRSSRTEFMWAVGLVLAIFIAGYALVHQMRTQFSDFMAKMVDMHIQMVAKMAELQGSVANLQAEMVHLRSAVDVKIANLQSDMNAKIGTLQSDMTVKMADLRSDVGDVKIDVGGLKKDVAIVQNDVRTLNGKVDRIDEYMAEVERSTGAQLTDIRETLAKQQEIKSDTETPKTEADSFEP